MSRIRPAGRPRAAGPPARIAHFIVLYLARASGKLTCDLDDELAALLWFPRALLGATAVSAEEFFALVGRIECGTLPTPFRLLPSSELRALLRRLLERL